MKTLIKGAFFGGIIAFVWMNISWMVLPWHQKTIATLPDDEPVAESLRMHVPANGLYILPWTSDHSKEAMAAFNEKMDRGPFAFMVVYPNGIKMNMTQMMLYGLLFNIVVALILTWLLTKTKGLSYIQKIGFVKVAALAGAMVILVPNLIWWHFPMAYTLITFIDTAITWGLAGLAIGKVVKD